MQAAAKRIGNYILEHFTPKMHFMIHPNSKIYMHQQKTITNKNIGIVEFFGKLWQKNWGEGGLDSLYSRS